MAESDSLNQAHWQGRRYALREGIIRYDDSKRWNVEFRPLMYQSQVWLNRPDTVTGWVKDQAGLDRMTRQMIVQRATDGPAWWHHSKIQATGLDA